MPTSGGYTPLKTWTAVSASETVPTTASTFVTPEFFPGADSVEVRFSEFTTDASATTGTVELWVKTRDADGTEIVIPYDADAGSITSGSTSVIIDGVSHTSVPAGSWFARLLVTAGTTPTITGDAYIRYYKS